MIIELANKQDVIRIADMYSKLYSHVHKKPNGVRKKGQIYLTGLKFITMRSFYD